MPDWSGLLPAVTSAAGAIPATTFNPGSDGPVGPVGSRWGVDKYVELGRAALGAYQAWKSAPVHGFIDFSDPNFVPHQELAKMIAQYGAIPADSDLGELAVSAGARTYRQRVKFNDGTYHTIEVVQVGSRRGGADSPEGAPPRARRKNLTRDRLATAGWVMRKLKAQQKLGRRLASLAQSLYPRKSKGFKGRRK